MDQVRYPCFLQYGHSDGNRPKGRPNKNIEEDCSDLGVTLYEVTQFAEDIIRNAGCQRATT